MEVEAMTAAEVADQIAKGVDAKRCTHRLVRGYFIFLALRSVNKAAFVSMVSIGSISSEYLEHIDEQKPREKRRLIREKIRTLRDGFNQMESTENDYE